MTSSEALYQAAERRIERLTLGLGAAASIGSGIRWGWKTALGLALGAVLAWLNFRWLKLGVYALAQLSRAQMGQPNPRVPLAIYAKFFGRLALLLGIVYVILSRSLLPAEAVLAGLFVLVGAVLAVVVWTVIQGWRAT
jgi:hypothetical protein